MRLRILTVLVLVALFSPALGQDAVQELEPNDDPKTAAQEIRPGQAYEAAFQKKGDVDCVVLRCERERILSFRWILEEGVHFKSIRIGKPVPVASPRRSRDLKMIRLRVPAGRTVIQIGHYVRARTGGYRMETRIEEEDPGLETEPNGRPRNATPFTLGTPILAWNSTSWGDTDHFRIRIAERGVYRLRIEALEAPTPPEDDRRAGGRAILKILLTAGDVRYHYEVDKLADTFEFFPVLDPGEFILQVGFRRGATGAPYRLQLERFDITVTPEHEEAARRAIDRGVSWLVDVDVDSDKARYPVAADAIALMALAEGSGAPDRAAERSRKVEALVEAIAKRGKEEEGGSWQGTPVIQFGRRMYEHAFATLALAEAASQGSERARELCREGVRFLLASQVSERRPDAWKVVVGAGQRGGWRYTPNTEEGDLSVTGWCLVALYAAAAAEVEVEGLVEAAEWAAEFTKICAVSTVGFMYRPGVGGRPSAIGQSIGLLVALLFGDRHQAARVAADEIDNHLCAGTQTAHGQNCPFYYWYYATRANYLRGGYAWEAWRAVAIRQLVRRQEADGSWAALHEETDAAHRYSTGMAVMILRLCIGEPPHYMSRDVEGF